MSRHTETQMTAEARRDLDAIDAALAGEPLSDRTLAPLAELAIALRDIRPRPEPSFTIELDQRAADGFRTPGPRSARLARRGGMRAKLLVRGPAAACAAAVVALLVVLGGSGGTHRTDRASRLGPSGPVTQTSAPSKGPAIAAGGAGVAGAPGAALSEGAREPGTPSPDAMGTATRHVERTAALDVGVAPDQVQSAAHRVFTIVGSFGGYVQTSNVSSGGGESGATFQLRVPAGSVSGAISALSHLGHVRFESDTTNDVTGQYDALRRSLEEARAERAGLLRRLAGTVTAAEAEALRARLAGVDARISNLEASLHELTSRIDYTPLALSLTPEQPSAGSGFGSDLTPGGAAHDAARLLDAALAVVVIAAAAMLPVGLLAIGAWGVIAATRRRLREQVLDANP